MSRFWFGLVLVLAGFGAGWLVWGRKAPPPPAGGEHHYDTTYRVDTTNFVPPAVTAQLKALRGAIASFLADTARKPDSVCVRLLAQAGLTLDTLRAALASRPAVRLTLHDSLKFKWPVAALWDTVRYAADGEIARIDWGYGYKYAPLADKGRLGAVFSYGTDGGIAYGGQLRVSRSAALQVQKAKKGWQVGGVWFLW